MSAKAIIGLLKKFDYFLLKASGLTEGVHHWSTFQNGEKEKKENFVDLATNRSHFMI